MFFTIKEYLKEKKQKDELKEIEKKSKEEKTSEGFSSDEKKQQNSDKNKINKSNNSKKSKKNTKDKNENALSKFLKRNKENSKTDYQKNKDKKKKEKIKKKKERRKLLYNKNAYPFYYQLILEILVFIVIMNIFVNTFSSGYKMTGTLVYENNKYLFIPNFSEVILNNFEELRGLKKGDTVYVYYDKKQETFKYSLEKKLFKMNIEGVVTKCTDYYLKIDFDFDNEIKEGSYYLKKYKTGEEFTVNIKKFMFEYVIDEPLKDSIIDNIKNSLGEIKKND